MNCYSYINEVVLIIWQKKPLAEILTIVISCFMYLLLKTTFNLTKIATKKYQK